MSGANPSKYGASVRLVVPLFAQAQERAVAEGSGDCGWQCKASASINFEVNASEKLYIWIWRVSETLVVYVHTFG